MSLPTTFAALLAAVVDQLQFHASTAKLTYGNRFQSLEALSLENESVNVDLLMPTSASTTGPPSVLTVMVFGLPRRVWRILSSHQNEQNKVHQPQGPLLVSSPSSPDNPHMSSPVPGSFVPHFPGPLPYPHCPDGLQELYAITNTAHGGLLIPPMEYYSQAFYNHPTTQFIIAEVSGNLDRLHDMMSQIAIACPPLFAWSARNPQLFVRYLNRQGPSAMENGIQLLMQEITTSMQTGQRHFTLELNDARMGLLGELLVEVNPQDDNSSSIPGGSVPDDLWSSSYDEDMGTVWAEETSMLENLAYIYQNEESVDYSSASDDGHPEEPSQTDIEAEVRRLPNAAVHIPTPPPVPPPATSGRCARRPSVPLEVVRSYCPPPPVEPIPSHSQSEAARVEDEVRMPRVACQRPSFIKTTFAQRAHSPSLDRTDAQVGFPRTRSSIICPNLMPSGSGLGVDPLYAQLESELLLLDGRVETWAHTENTTALTDIHGEFQRHSDTFLTELAANLEHVVNEQNFVWLTQTAIAFFSKAEEFYLNAADHGARPTLLGTEPTASLPAYAFTAAVSRLLVSEADRAVKRCAAAASMETSSMHSKSNGASPTLLRIGALRNLPADHSPLMDPCARWVTATGPSRLLSELLALAQAERTAVLWYSAHYILHPTRERQLSAVAYVISSTDGVSAKRLAVKTPPTACGVPPVDRIANSLCLIKQCGSCVPDDLRAAWSALMRDGYDELVKCVEPLLPPAYSVPFLFVVDTRHTAALHTAAAAAAPAPLGSGRWFPALCDDHGVPCLDKWAVTVSEAPWRLVLASEARTFVPSAEDAQVVVLSNSDAPQRSAWAAALRNEQRPQAKVAYHSLEGKSLSQSHAVVLHETIGAGYALCPASPTRPAAFGLSARIVGDLHILDDCSDPTGWGNVAALTTNRATLFHSVELCPNSENFYKGLYGRLRLQENIPIAAAVRQALLKEAYEAYAPWLLVEYTLLDYGGCLEHLAAPASPLVNPREQQRWRQYAEANAVDDLFEMMLERVKETQPEGEAALVDDLIAYVERSSETMTQRVMDRRREAAEGPVVGNGPTAGSETLVGGGHNTTAVPEARSRPPVRPKPSHRGRFRRQ